MFVSVKSRAYLFSGKKQVVLGPGGSNFGVAPLFRSKSEDQNSVICPRVRTRLPSLTDLMSHIAFVRKELNELNIDR